MGPPLPSFVGTARRFVRSALTADHEHLADDAELAVSEVVTNAVVHAGTRIAVRVALAADTVRVEVEDGSPHLPRARRYADTAGTGRGLRLLADLVDRWGATSNATGKVVWFELTGEPVGDRRSGGPAVERGTRPAVPEGAVELLDVPVLLYGAWRQHADSLLREYLLATLDEADADAAISVHAAASDALGLLDEAVPIVPIPETPAAAMAAATSPAASRRRVRVHLPPGSRAHFGSLEDALEGALRLADAGSFLTPPVQPELRELRRWLCRQVAVQAAGGPPERWRPMDEPLPAPRTSRASSWDAEPVRESARAVVAADDLGRIVAASRGAFELLGHDHRGSPSTLVGQRLVGLIPTRYRQAHLAGFTRHLLTGGGVLLGTTVQVSVMRRDGTEVPVRLTLLEERDDEGRTVFLADLEAASAGPG
jgi:PAS domain S-box-containing protein